MGRPRKDVPSASVTLRFEQKNKYLAELAAQEQDMSLNRFVELAVEQALMLPTGKYRDESLWHDDHFQRFRLRVESGRKLSFDDDFRVRTVKANAKLCKRDKINWKAVEAEWDLVLKSAEADKQKTLLEWSNARRVRNIDQVRKGV